MADIPDELDAMAEKPGKKRIGRPPGSLNKVTADVRALAQKYTLPALATLAKIMRTGQSEQARVAAANSLLDRAHGRSPQAIEATVSGRNGGPIEVRDMTDTQRAARLASIIALVQARQAATPEDGSAESQD